MPISRWAGDCRVFASRGSGTIRSSRRRDAIFADRWGIAPSIAIGLGTPTTLTASYYHLTSHELPDSGIPFLYTLANAPLGSTYNEPALGRITTISGQTGVVDRAAFYGLVDRDFRDTTTDQAVIRAQHDFGGVTLRNTSRFTHNFQRYSFLLPDDSQGNVFGTDPSNPATAGGLVWRRSNSRVAATESIVNQTRPVRQLRDRLDQSRLRDRCRTGVGKGAARGTRHCARAQLQPALHPDRDRAILLHQPVQPESE